MRISDWSSDVCSSDLYYLVPNSYIFRQISETDKRDAAFGAIQWRPSDQFNVNLDVQYSDRTFVESRRDLTISEARRGLTNLEYDETNGRTTWWERVGWYEWI